MTILLSPWSRLTTDGKPSPKNYPWWEAVVRELPDVVQISCKGEPDVKGCARRIDDLPLSKLKELIRECRTWMSVDNAIQHLAWSIGKRGVVVFGPSDPIIFGHPENVNLLKDRKNLREWQFRFWSLDTWKPEIFPSPIDVIRAVQML